MSISAGDVKKLRDMTGAGMMDAKKALSENDGDLTKLLSICVKKAWQTLKKEQIKMLIKEQLAITFITNKTEQ